MSVSREIEFDSIERIFAQRDERRRAEMLQEARTTARPVRAADSPSYFQRGGQYERTPYEDEFEPSTKRGAVKEDVERTSENVRKRASKAKNKKGGKRNKRYSVNNRPQSTAEGGGVKLSRGATLAAALLAAVGIAAGGIIAVSDDSPVVDIDTNSSGLPDKAMVVESEAPTYNVMTEDGEEYVVDFDGNEEDAEPEITDGFVDDGFLVDGNLIPYCSMENVSDNCIEAIKGFEGFFNEAYVCPGGKLTIGTGHTGPDVYEGQVITDEEGAELLRSDMQAAMNAVRKYAQGLDLQLTQGQFDALTSFTFNCGPGRFRDSGIAEALADGDKGVDEAARIMKLYVKSDGEELPGLVTRRAEEASWLYQNI